MFFRFLAFAFQPLERLHKSIKAFVGRQVEGLILAKTKLSFIFEDQTFRGVTRVFSGFFTPFAIPPYTLIL